MIQFDDSVDVTHLIRHVLFQTFPTRWAPSLVIRGARGPLEMAENKWVTGVIELHLYLAGLCLVMSKWANNCHFPY